MSCIVIESGGGSKKQPLAQSLPLRGYSHRYRQRAQQHLSDVMLLHVFLSCRWIVYVNAKIDISQYVFVPVNRPRNLLKISRVS